MQSGELCETLLTPLSVTQGKNQSANDCKTLRFEASQLCTFPACDVNGADWPLLRQLIKLNHNRRGFWPSAIATAEVSKSRAHCPKLTFHKPLTSHKQLPHWGKTFL